MQSGELFETRAPYSSPRARPIRSQHGPNSLGFCRLSDAVGEACCDRPFTPVFQLARGVPLVHSPDSVLDPSTLDRDSDASRAAHRLPRPFYRRVLRPPAVPVPFPLFIGPSRETVARFFPEVEGFISRPNRFSASLRSCWRA